jgi:hypothetical protein
MSDPVVVFAGAQVKRTTENEEKSLETGEQSCGRTKTRHDEC